MPLPIARLRTRVNRKAQPHQLAESPPHSHTPDIPFPSVLSAVDHAMANCSHGGPRSAQPTSPSHLEMLATIFNATAGSTIASPTRRRPPHSPHSRTSCLKVRACKIAHCTAEVDANSIPAPIRPRCLTDITWCASTGSTSPERSSVPHQDSSEHRSPPVTNSASTTGDTSSPATSSI